jgi:hypothetical protein
MYMVAPFTHVTNSFISADVMTAVAKILNGRWAAESAGTSVQGTEFHSGCFSDNPFLGLPRSILPWIRLRAFGISLDHFTSFCKLLRAGMVNLHTNGCQIQDKCSLSVMHMAAVLLIPVDLRGLNGISRSRILSGQLSPFSDGQDNRG